MRLKIRLAVRLVIALACLDASAADHALLVGVSRYPALPRALWLEGPANDVRLMREALLARGFDPRLVSSLSDAPTRADILGAMAGVLDQVRPGDRVVFHYAGHGSQQPQPSHPRYPEPDGLDEVLLPSDAGRWQGAGQIEAIPNAIIDDEIGDWIDALVDKGATVWAFFDTCHAAGMARGASKPLSRAVAPADLGLPREAQPRATRSLGSPRLDGRVLVFAGRSHERVAEEWLPRGAGFAATQRHGVFSWHVAALLREQGLGGGPALLAALQKRYSDEGRTRPVPMLAGATTSARR